MNIVFFGGKVFKDIEFSDGKNKNYAKFTLMVQSRVKTDKGFSNDFFNCTAWLKTADIIKKFNFGDGDYMLIRGCINTNKYNGKSYQNVTVDEVITETKRIKNSADPAEHKVESDDSFVEVENFDDLPF